MGKGLGVTGTQNGRDIKDIERKLAINTSSILIQIFVNLHSD